MMSGSVPNHEVGDCVGQVGIPFRRNFSVCHASADLLGDRGRRLPPTTRSTSRVAPPRAAAVLLAERRKPAPQRRSMLRLDPSLIEATRVPHVGLCCTNGELAMVPTDNASRGPERLWSATTS